MGEPKSLFRFRLDPWPPLTYVPSRLWASRMTKGGAPLAEVRYPQARTPFSDYLVACNGLEEAGFERWAFYPEMLFGARGKWWGDRGRRPRTHEGIDLCLFTNKAGQALRLRESSRIPVMFDGEIVRIEEDFVGESLYVGHRIGDGWGRQLFTIYGHTKPADGVRTGGRFRQGEVIATLSSADRRPAGAFTHLHLSVAWVSKTQALEELNWELLHDPGVAILLDPLRVMDRPYKILAPDTPVNSC